MPVDIIGPEDDFSKYRIVIAPLFYMVGDGVKERMEDYVSKGGILLFTYYSGYVDENAHILKGGYPGCLRELIGARIEESDLLYEDMDHFVCDGVWIPGHVDDMSNSFTYNGVEYPAYKICDIMYVEGAQVLSVFNEDFYSGHPAITRNSMGKGFTYYVATSSSAEFYSDLIKNLCDEAGIGNAFDMSIEAVKEWEGIEIAVRQNDAKKVYYLINHTDEEKEVMFPFDGEELTENVRVEAGQTVTLAGTGVKVICVKL